MNQYDSASQSPHQWSELLRHSIASHDNQPHEYIVHDGKGYHLLPSTKQRLSLQEIKEISKNTIEELSSLNVSNEEILKNKALAGQIANHTRQLIKTREEKYNQFSNRALRTIGLIVSAVASVALIGIPFFILLRNQASRFHQEMDELRKEIFDPNAPFGPIRDDPYTSLPANSGIRGPTLASSPKKWLEANRNQFEKELIQKNLPKMCEASERFLFQERKALDENRKAISQVALYANELRCLVNLKAIEDLRTRLVNSVGEKFAEKILGDWSIIGEDIQKNLSVLSEKRKEEILENAQRFAVKELDKALEELKAHLNKGVPLSELQLRFPHLSKEKGVFALPEKILTDKMQAFHTVVNTAMINQLVKKPTSFTPSPMVGSFLTALGFNGKAFNDREMLHARLDQLLNVLVGDESLGSIEIDNVRQMVVEAQKVERFKLAEVPDDVVGNVRDVIRIATKWKQAEEKQAIESFEKNNALAQLGETQPQFKKMIEIEIKKKIQGQFSQQIRKVLSNNKDEILADPSKLQEQLSRTREEVLKNIETMIPEWTKKHIEWNQKYGQYVVKELIQGSDDPQSVLLEGCCYGVTSRVADNAMDQKELNDDLLGAEIRPFDRVLQAKHKVTRSAVVRLGKQRDRQDEILLKEVQKEAWHTLIRDTKFPESVQGVAKIYLQFFDPKTDARQSGHATLIQINHASSAYRIFDPNLALLRFPKFPDKTDAEMTDFCLEAYEDLLQLLYSEERYNYTVVVSPKS